MLPELKITQLRHFVWVAELKGFHAAAAKAHRTQPAISLSIRDLESKLGEALFEKRNSKTELTAFGKHLLPQAKELIAHHDRVAQDMCLMREHKVGHLRLASVPSIASRVFPEILSKFIANVPNLHISFYDDHTDAVLKMVENQLVDFGIASVWNEHAHSDKVFTPIWEDQIGIVCRYDHPLAEAEGLHWQQLSEHRLISNGTTRLLEDSEAKPLLAESQFYISNMVSLKAMLEAGMGITTLPRFAFDPDSENLRFVPLTTPAVVRRIGIVRLKNKTLSPAAEALIEFILATSQSHQEAILKPSR